jgi:hypothetical protein
MKKLYLLDANTLIDAKNHYYPIDRVPEFWSWLIHQGQLGNIKIPIEIYEEFKDTRSKKGEQDELAFWASQPHVKEALLLNENAESNTVIDVIQEGYNITPTDEDLLKMGRDPFLISYAYKNSSERCVVTTEGSRPSRKGANRHVPDVCKALNVRCINSFELIKELNFTTGWDGQI